MIFFGIPSVGQIKPETLFGDDNHYGFIQTLFGEEYKRSVISKKCCKYYDKETNGYWDRIITISNFLGIKKLNKDNRFSEIPLLDFVAEKFDQSDYKPSQVLFNYLLCQWQYPHPVVTTSANLNAIDFDMVNPRQNATICKPYILILAVLKELYKISPESSYFTKEEFYWFVYQAYESNCSNMVIENANVLAISILDIREHGWSKFESISKSNVHLSYPLGFLRNSYVLTDNGTEYNADSKFFIGLRKYSSILIDINSLIDSSRKVFEFNRKASVQDNMLGFEYSDYLYNIDSLKKWLKKVTIYDNNENLFINLSNNFDTFDDVELRKNKIKRQLNRLSDLDKISISKRRTEQYILREFLLGGNDFGSCAICNNTYPVKFLATAHIKKRAECTEEEKRDINVVMPTCHLGCDKLFEEGYVIVRDGSVQNNVLQKLITSPITQYISKIENKNCSYYNEKTKRYFKEHEGRYV